jgi:SSS family solute:Na+ symporter
LVLLFVAAVGLFSGSRVKSAEDFMTSGGKAGSGIVSGTFVGTLVGGAATIGAAQLAFSCGFSAWSFTLGCCLACLTLACCYGRSLYESGVSTMPRILAKEFGRGAATAAAVLTSLGSLLSVPSQVLSGAALVTSISGMPVVPAAGIAVALMFVYVLFGGIWGTGLAGMAKTALLCATVGVCGITAFSLQGGWSAFSVLPAERYFNLFARGTVVETGAMLSVVLGVVTTQTYIQTFVSARTLRSARTGVFISAALIPLIGLAGVFVGLYMRINAPDIDPAQALPLFILRHMPPLFGGAVFATLLITVVGTAAGVSLGMGTMFCHDIYRVYFNPHAEGKTLLRVSRLVIAVILVCAALLTLGDPGSLILNWTFMSMGLRGAVAFGVVTAAVFIPGRIDGRYAVWSMIAGPVCVLAGKSLFGHVADPLFFGVAGSLIVLAAGYFRRRDIRRSAP